MKKTSVLSEKNILSDPVGQFARWFTLARKEKRICLPEAFCLATLGKNRVPEGRMILLKSFDARGFVFYTHLDSPKGQSLKKNKKASMTFYWEQLKRQVRIVGTTTLVTDHEANVYFQSRPRDSRIGAWASLQSRVLDSRRTLEDKFEFFKKKFAGKKVPRPSWWMGLRLKPLALEFWQERENRLHDRFLFTKKKRGWKIQRLYP